MTRSHIKALPKADKAQASRAAQLAKKPPASSNYHDYAGVIHVHTAGYSHDANGKFEDAVRVANDQRLDFLITTEHNNLRALKDGKQGWYGTTLVLIGMEISTRDGHYVALNVNQEIDKDKLDTQQIIDAVNEQGGLGFIAHPYYAKARWRNWSVHGFTGMEIYNVAHDTLDENKLRLIVWTLTSPAEPFYYSILDRPYDPLARWDELIRLHGKVVGIASTDAHEFHVMGIKFAPYEDLFQICRTHLLIPEKPLTVQTVYSALREGHAYAAIELNGETRGFMFAAFDGQKTAGIMGDEVAFSASLQLQVELPATADLTLFKDGQTLGSRRAQHWEIAVKEPGVYRVEASRNGKPWIFSNPIYVRPAATVADSPRS